jgi:hypothetical protein
MEVDEAWLASFIYCEPENEQGSLLRGTSSCLVTTNNMYLAATALTPDLSIPIPTVRCSAPYRFSVTRYSFKTVQNAFKKKRNRIKFGSVQNFTCIMPGYFHNSWSRLCHDSNSHESRMVPPAVSS